MALVAALGACFESGTKLIGGAEILRTEQTETRIITQVLSYTLYAVCSASRKRHTAEHFGSGVRAPVNCSQRARRAAAGQRMISRSMLYIVKSGVTNSVNEVIESLRFGFSS